MSYQSNILTIKYLIDFLNEKKDIKIDKKKYIIDSYSSLKINSNITYDNLITILLISCKNTKYIVDDNYRISCSDNEIRKVKQDIYDYIFNSSIEPAKKKKYTTFITSSFNSDNIYPINESILILTYFFCINLLIYNTESQITKCYYYYEHLDNELPFVIIKESKDTNTSNLYYELIFSQDKFIFDFKHPIVIELINDAFIIGFEPNKKLEYLQLSANNLDNVDNIDNLDITGDKYFSEMLEADKPIIKLKMIPEKILKFLEEFNL
jgi:hypothetical protein